MLRFNVGVRARPFDLDGSIHMDVFLRQLVCGVALAEFGIVQMLMVLWLSVWPGLLLQRFLCLSNFWQIALPSSCKKWRCEWRREWECKWRCEWNEGDDLEFVEKINNLIENMALNCFSNDYIFSLTNFILRLDSNGIIMHKNK